MKLTLPLLALAASSAYAQNVTPSACLSVAAAVPSCALSCISSAASRASCGQFDLACQCGTASSAINSYAQGCVIAACTPIESALAVASSAGAVCSCVATVPGGGSGGAATTSAASGASTSMASMTASSGASITGGSTATGSSSAGVTSAASSRASSGSSAAGSQTTIGPATTQSLSLVGAGNVVGPIGGIAAGFLGLAALL